jgi:hypothetical protein
MTSYGIEVYPEFRPGDRVKVIATDSYFPDIFQMGEIFTVREVVGPCLRFEESPHGPYASKFELFEAGSPTYGDEYEEALADQDIYAALIDAGG